MAQHDYVIANGTGAAVRSDLNNGLAAIVSQNSGATEPATMYAYQWWADTTTGLLKIRNSANNAWVTVGTLASANLGLAALASPTFTGTVTAPTFTASTAVNIPLGSAGSPTLFFTGDSNTGLFSPGADAIALATAGTNRLHITSGGLVGIGTTSPVSTLTVNGIGAFGANSGSADVSAARELYIRGSSNSSLISFQTSTTGSNGFLVGAIASEGRVQMADAFPITFHTSNTERARIDSSGRLLVGTSTGVGANSARLQIKGAAGGVAPFAKYSLVSGFDEEAGGIALTSSSENSISIQADPDNLRASSNISFSVDATERMTLFSDGNIKIGNTSSAYVYPGIDNSLYLGSPSFRWNLVYSVNGTASSSDEREKTEIDDALLGIDFVKSLRPVSYKWKIGHNDVETSDEGDVTIPRPGIRTHWGFLAQEVKQSADDAGVDFGGWILTDTKDPESPQGLRYQQFIAPLTKALQEAIAKIEQLETEMAAVKAQLA